MVEYVYEDFLNDLEISCKLEIQSISIEKLVGELGGAAQKIQRPLPAAVVFGERKGVERKRSIENKKRRLGGSAIRLASLW